MLYMSFAPSSSVFFYSVIFGVILGMIWDCFRIVRKNIGNIKFLVFILDVIYFILLTIFTICFFFFFTFGGFRIFVLIGEFLGFILYYSTVERPIFFILNSIISPIFKLFYIIFRFFKKWFLKLTNYSERKAKVISKKVLNANISTTTVKPKFQTILHKIFKFKK